ncbi:DUF1758 domain-containing protein [Nephila pilipes]|uniref:DUF1758 domain-containing protein n=1 Tax=Nephila pilipes TaxID=299642 RepID=A0A8X6T9H0_NEPPI|nr:DUF1758 domain-containing protein [Nephila pilipes]
MKNPLVINNGNEKEYCETVNKNSNTKGLGIRDDPVLHERDQAMEIFKETVEFENGRYIVQLPFRKSYNELSDNYFLAKQRFQNLWRRFGHDSELYQQYREIILDYTEQGINLNPNLLDLLINFRLNTIALCSDIKQAFLQMPFDFSGVMTNRVFIKSPNYSKKQNSREIFEADSSIQNTEIINQYATARLNPNSAPFEGFIDNSRAFTGTSVNKMNHVKTALLSKTIIYMKDRFGELKPIRALLDVGSMFSLMNKQIQIFWRLEDKGIKDVPTYNDYDKSLDSLKKSIAYIDGRYEKSYIEVELSWKKRLERAPR